MSRTTNRDRFLEKRRSERRERRAQRRRAEEGSERWINRYPEFPETDIDDVLGGWTPEWTRDELERAREADEAGLLRTVPIPGLGATTTFGKDRWIEHDPFDMISKVTDTIFVGGAIHPEDLPRLREYGITHIIDAQIERDDAKWLPANEFGYLWLPTNDDGRTKPLEWFEAAINFARRAVRDNPQAKFYIHCGMGINRGPSLALAVLRDQTGLLQSEATRLLRQKRPEISDWGLAYAKDADRALKTLAYERLDRAS